MTIASAILGYSMSMHIHLPVELKEKLKIFAKNRRKSMSSAIQYSLGLLFEVEDLNPAKEEALRVVISRKFTIPRGFTLRSFWLTLYMLAAKYPDESSVSFWGDMVYLSQVDKTHKEILTEVLEERARLLK